jgi:hypothetical protein
MRKFFAVALGSVVALVGFAGAASASGTVDLIWRSSGTDTVTGVDTSSSITADVVLTAGDGGISSAGLSIDYSDALAAGSITLVSFVCTADGTFFQFCLSNGVDSGSQINTMSVGTFGDGLTDGNSVSMGNVTFHKQANPDGTFVFPVGILVGTDGMFNSAGEDIGPDSIYNPAFLVNVPEPGAISMLVMGLSGVLLAGRGRRS